MAIFSYWQVLNPPSNVLNPPSNVLSSSTFSWFINLPVYLLPLIFYRLIWLKCFTTITISEFFLLFHLPSHSHVPSLPLLFPLFCNVSSKDHAFYIHLSGAIGKSHRSTAAVQTYISILPYVLYCFQSAGKNEGVHNSRNYFLKLLSRTGFFHHSVLSITQQILHIRDLYQESVENTKP